MTIGNIEASAGRRRSPCAQLAGCSGESRRRSSRTNARPLDAVVAPDTRSRHRSGLHLRQAAASATTPVEIASTGMARRPPDRPTSSLTAMTRRDHCDRSAGNIVPQIPHRTFARRWCAVIRATVRRVVHSRAEKGSTRRRSRRVLPGRTHRDLGPEEEGHICCLSART